MSMNFFRFPPLPAAAAGLALPVRAA
jgi:hypothetical protein